MVFRSAHNTLRAVGVVISWGKVLECGKCFDVCFQWHGRFVVKPYNIRHRSILRLVCIGAFVCIDVRIVMASREGFNIHARIL